MYIYPEKVQASNCLFFCYLKVLAILLLDIDTHAHSSVLIQHHIVFNIIFGKQQLMCVRIFSFLHAWVLFTPVKFYHCKYTTVETGDHKVAYGGGCTFIIKCK